MKVSCVECLLYSEAGMDYAGIWPWHIVCIVVVLILSITLKNFEMTPHCFIF